MEKTLELHNIEFRVFKTSDGQTVLDKIVFETTDAPAEQVTYTPKKQVKETETVNGVPTVSYSTRKLLVSELADEFEGIVNAKEKLDVGQSVTLQADVSSTADFNDEDEQEYWYIDREDEETIELRAEDE